jgi:CIC family chloride channel protein
MGIASVVGVAAGLAAIAFEALIHLCKRLALHAPFALPPGQEGLGGGGPFPWWIVVVPAVGGLAAGWLISTFAPAARGHGTEQVIQVFHRRAGRVEKRVIAVKALASALTIGTGGSAGQEGPVAQVGGGFGSNLSDAFGLGDRDRRVFLLAGATAGIGAMFSAPLGAALFVPEVLYKKPEFEGDAIIPCIVAAILAHTTKVTLQPAEFKEIRIPDAILDGLGFHGARELPVYLALALLCVVVGWVYVRFFHWFQRAFARLPVPAWIRPGLGGLLLGLLAVAIAPLAGEHGVLFGGYGLIVDSIRGSIPLQLLALLIGGKILATSFSIGSGGSGGMFAPSLAIGAMLGSTVGQLAQQLPFGAELDPSSFALVGMGGFFAGVAKTPVAATIIVCEMTGSYALLTPLMLVGVVHVLLARRWTLYESQVEGLVDSPAHAGEFVVVVLERGGG